MTIPSTTAIARLSSVPPAYGVQALYPPQAVATRLNAGDGDTDGVGIRGLGQRGSGQFLGSVIQALQQSGVNLQTVSAVPQVQTVQQALNQFVHSLFQALSQQDANVPLGVQSAVPRQGGIQSNGSFNSLQLFGNTGAYGIGDRGQQLTFETQKLSQVLASDSALSNPALSELASSFKNLVTAAGGNDAADFGNTQTSASGLSLSSFVQSLSQYLGIGTPYSAIGNLVSATA